MALTKVLADDFQKQSEEFVTAVNVACRIVVEILFGFAACFCVDYARIDRRRNPGKILV